MNRFKICFRSRKIPGEVAELVGTSSCTTKGYRFDPQSGMYRRQLINVSLSLCLSPPLPPSLKSINVSSGEDEKKNETKDVADKLKVKRRKRKNPG